MWNTCWWGDRRIHIIRTTKVKVKLLQLFTHAFTLACKMYFVTQTSAPAPDSDQRIHARSQMLSVSPDAFPPCVNMKRRDEKEKNTLSIYLKYICNTESLKESRFGLGRGECSQTWSCSSCPVTLTVLLSPTDLSKPTRLYENCTSLPRSCQSPSCSVLPLYKETRPQMPLAIQAGRFQPGTVHPARGEREVRVVWKPPCLFRLKEQEIRLHICRKSVKF